MITLSEIPAGFGAALARELIASLSAEQRLVLARDLLDAPERRELIRELALISPEEGAALVRWTASGFLRVTTRENCPHLKLGHKQPELFSLPDVEAMFSRLKVWPKGKPMELAA